MADRYENTIEQSKSDIFLEVHLNNDEIIYEDRNSKHWLKIGDYIKNNNLSIKKIALRCPQKDIILTTTEKEKGYFYGKKIMKTFQDNKQHDFIGIGYYNGENVVIRWFAIPDFKPIIKETRTKNKAGFMLICNEQ